jgi:hypothetical protein
VVSGQVNVLEVFQDFIGDRGVTNYRILHIELQEFLRLVSGDLLEIKMKRRVGGQAQGGGRRDRGREGRGRRSGA